MLTNISPIDSRYQNNVQELAIFFSEESLFKYRIKIEIEYLIALCGVLYIKELKPLSSRKKTELRNFYKKFSSKDAKKIKRIEVKIHHDVKAVEYFIQDKLKQIGSAELIPWVHIAITSEDVNNLSYSLMWQDGLTNVYLPILKKVLAKIKAYAKRYQNVALLSMTHGQPATPTTIGKEFSVFYHRINRQVDYLKSHKLLGKFGGATGTWAAHNITYPNVDWIKFSHKFIKSLKLEPNLITTQVEPRDSLIESYQAITRFNSIFIDFCQDIWLYISRDIFKQKRVVGEVGSSTMPHKINPITFENAEGNLGISNALFTHFAAKLSISRLQRDLSDSTVLRNQGVALAHSLLALKNVLKGLDRLSVNTETARDELNSHWEVLAEAVQTILRKNGQENAFEKLKELTRGKKITQEIIIDFVQGLDLPVADKERLISLTPESYVGLAPELVSRL